jgi:hypothetical protein
MSLRDHWVFLCIWEACSEIWILGFSNAGLSAILQVLIDILLFDRLKLTITMFQTAPSGFNKLNSQLADMFFESKAKTDT